MFSISLMESNYLCLDWALTWNDVNFSVEFFLALIEVMGTYRSFVWQVVKIKLWRMDSWTQVHIIVGLIMSSSAEWYKHLKIPWNKLGKRGEIHPWGRNSHCLLSLHFMEEYMNLYEKILHRCWRDIEESNKKKHVSEMLENAPSEPNHIFKSKTFQQNPHGCWEINKHIRQKS